MSELLINLIEATKELEALRVALRTAKWSDGSQERICDAIDALVPKVREMNVAYREIEAQS